MTITRVNEENAEVFYDLAPDEYLPPETLNRRMVFGALTGDKGEGEPAGLLIFDLAFGGFEENRPYWILELLWLFVDGRKRGQGYGRALIEQLFTIADTAGFNELRCSFPLMGVPEGLKEFLEHFGFEFSHGERIELSAPLRAFLETGHFKKDAAEEKVLSLEEFSDKQLGDAFEILGFDVDVLSGEEELHFEPDISAAILQKKAVSGFFLIGSRLENYEELELEPILFRVLPGVTSQDTYELLHYSIKRVVEYYGAEVNIHIETEHPTAVKLVKYLIPDVQSLEIECGYRRGASK